MSHIELRGVRVHNLKGIDVRLPLGKLIAITGVSGAGKSSLAFDTLVAEGRRRYIETFAPSARQFLERIERPDADAIEHLPPAVALRGEGSFDARATLGTITETDDLLRMLFARLGQAFCPHCHSPLKAQTPDDVCRELLAWPDGTRFVVTFPTENTDTAIARWRKLGFVRTIDPSEFKSQISDFKTEATDRSNPISKIPNQNSLVLIVVDRLIAGKTPAARILDSAEQAFQHGGERCIVLWESLPNQPVTGIPIEWDGRVWQLARFSRRLLCFDCDVEFPLVEPDSFSFESPLGACSECGGFGSIERDGHRRSCPTCDGSRLSPFGRSVRLGRVTSPTIVELRSMPIADLSSFIDDIAGAASDANRILVASAIKELSARLRTLAELGLDYLSLGRSPRTLSRGERQRIRLAGMLATRLDNAMYVLDEPAAGLHPSEQPRVLAALRRLQQAGNTVIVIEHQRTFIEAADEVIELGPGAGRDGGRIVFHGTADRGAGFQSAASGANKREQHAANGQVGNLPHGTLRLEGVTLHNLKDVTVEFPLGVLCAVTGVSGSGKSSLIQHTLYPALCQRFGISCTVEPVGKVAALSGVEQIDAVVFLDSAPIRRSARANAATMLHLLSEMRRLFAETTEAKVQNFTARHFSFNAAKGGRCPRCRGLGAVEIDMQFLANLSVVCPECHGSRFQSQVLDAKLRGLSIAEVLNLSAAEAFTFFRGQPQLQRRLKHLKDVGLGYLPLGQSASTLSRGECQRLKLATMLSSSSRTRTLFLMDEPTTGLHPSDVAVLLECFRRLVDVGHSLIVIEHRPEFIHCADWVIELGPGAGDAGGRVMNAVGRWGGGEVG